MRFKTLELSPLTKNYVETRLIMIRDDQLIKSFSNSIPSFPKFSETINNLKKEVEELDKKLKDKKNEIKKENARLLKENIDSLNYSQRVKDFLLNKIEKEFNI